MIRVKHIVISALAAPIILMAAYILWLPWVPALKTENPKTAAVIERRIEAARQKKARHEVRRTWRDLDRISPNLIHAVLLAEDDTFYRHRGFDFEQIKIAFKINWKKKRFAYGGSTLTQQLARTLYLSSKKSLLRKAKEAAIAFWMERSLSKKRILELYLNFAEWGDGVYGAQAAAQHYYQKDADELSPEEAVALASILPSPRKWSPHRVTAFMQRRRGNLMERMAKEGYLTESEREEDRTTLIQELPEQNGADTEDIEPLQTLTAPSPEGESPPDSPADQRPGSAQ